MPIFSGLKATASSGKKAGMALRALLSAAFTRLCTLGPADFLD
jgi:hypothetical protein